MKQPPDGNSRKNLAKSIGNTYNKITIYCLLDKLKKTTMYSIRKVAQFSLNRCPEMKLYNITNDILLKYTKEQGSSYWFDQELTENLLSLSDSEFVKECIMRSGNDLYTMEVFRGMWDEFLTLRFDKENNLLEDYQNPFRLFHQGESKNEIINFFDITFKIKDKFK